MNNLIEYVREILGTPNFYDTVNHQWDYGAFFEYSICAILLLVVVISVFKLVRLAFR